MELKKCKLGDIATVEISSVDKKTQAGEIPVRLCNFTDVYHNWAITKDMAGSFMQASVNQKEYDTFSLKKGQVAFTKDSETRDDIGIPTYIADDIENVVLGYHTALVTPDKSQLSGKYLNAFMNTNYIKQYFENNASGSGQRYTLSIDTLNSIPVLLPEIEMQEKIGDIFSNIDKKIALNRSINRNLEAMAKRLFDYWFVQYDFPNAEGKPYKASGGAMVDNPVLKRKIPEGWEVKPIAEIIEQYIGGEWGKEQPTGDATFMVRCVRGTDIADMNNNMPTRYITEKNKSKLLSANDFVIEISGGSPTQSTGRMAFINEEIVKRYNSRIVCSNFCQAMRLKNPAFVSFFYHLWQTFYDNGIFFNYEGKTSGIKNLQLETFLANNWCIPSAELAEKFNTVVKPLFAQKEKLKTENYQLTALRDKLLPLLMNGQVVVKPQEVNSDLLQD